MIDGAATDIFFEQSMVHLREERQENFEQKTCAELNPCPLKQAARAHISVPGIHSSNAGTTERAPT